MYCTKSFINILLGENRGNKDIDVRMKGGLAECGGSKEP